MTPAAVAARLARLGEEFGVPAAGVDALGRILALLAEYPTAPTTVREPARSVDVHVADSLSGLVLEPLRSAATIADLGAGAGFPGLALAAARPAARVALVESSGRKCAFMERAVQASALPNAHVVCARAEEWRQVSDVVTARALAPLAVIAEYAAPLLPIGGHLAAWKGARDAAEEAAADAAAGELGLERVDITRVQPFEGAEHRHLHLYRKVTETPERFPRRAGMARKRPLGGSTRA